MKPPSFMTITTEPGRRTSSGQELHVRVQVDRRSLSWLRFVYRHLRQNYPTAPRWRVVAASLRTVR